MSKECYGFSKQLQYDSTKKKKNLNIQKTYCLEKQNELYTLLYAGRKYVIIWTVHSKK